MVLEGPMISYASLWQGGRRMWQIQHDSSQGVRHLEFFGDLPPAFADLREVAIEQQRAEDEHSSLGMPGVDYVFEVPPDTAATMTGFRYGRRVEDDFYRNLQSLAPADGNVAADDSEPPRWWQWH
jgi:hypothetical protein